MTIFLETNNSQDGTFKETFFVVWLYGIYYILGRWILKNIKRWLKQISSLETKNINSRKISFWLYVWWVGLKVSGSMLNNFSWLGCKSASNYRQIEIARALTRQIMKVRVHYSGLGTSRSQNFDPIAGLLETKRNGINFFYMKSFVLWSLSCDVMRHHETRTAMRFP